MAKARQAEVEQFSKGHSNDIEVEQYAEVMESIAEDEEQEEDWKPVAVAVKMGRTPSKTSVQSGATEKVMEHRHKVAETKELNDNPNKVTSDTPVEDASDPPEEKEAVDDTGNKAQAEDLTSLDEEPELIKTVDPKEWWRLHDEWLHAAMQAAMGNTTLKSIPDLDNIKRVDRNPPQNTLKLEPTQSIIRCYDLCLKVTEGEDQINLFHQVFAKGYNKVCKADSKIILYPWAVMDRARQPTLVIKNPMDIPNTLPILRKFVHKLFLCTTGGDYHLQVLIGSEEDLATIMQTIGWWLKSTYQGMWLMDLQSAEETMCPGWLLFSASDYDCKELSREIWDFADVQVAIRFRAIEDGKKKEPTSKPDPKAPKPPPPIKALHVEIDKVNQGLNRARIETLYLSKATVFPLGIKMRFVHDYRLLTNSQVKAKAECLKAYQEWFLNQMETCITWEIATLDLEDHSAEATLRQLIMNILDQGNLASRLFHSVNKMFIKDGTILQFHPSRSQNARDVVASLCVYLKGLWQGMINNSKLNKFFTDTALDRAKDTWWDPFQKCVITKADEEMMSILQEDKDLIFPEKKIIVELPAGSTQGAMISQRNQDILSMGLVSTFQTTATPKMQTAHQTKTKVQLPLAATTVSSGSATTLSVSTLSEKDMSALLAYLMKAMNLPTLPSSPTNSGPPGGNKSRTKS